MIKNNDIWTLMLRKKAEEILKYKSIDNADKQHSEADMMRLLHEFEVHQIELELQYEELMQVKNNQQQIAKKYKELYDFAPTGYLTLSQDGEILELNLTTAKFLDKDRADIQNHRFHDFIAPETIAVFHEFFERIFETNETQNCEIIVSLKNDDLNYLFLNGKSIENGEKCLITATDVTERRMTEALRKSEEKFRLLTENSFDAIYLLYDKRFEYVNQRFCELTGYSSEDFLLGKVDAFQLLTNMASNQFDGGWKKYPGHERARSIFEMEIKTRDDRVIDVEVATTPIILGDRMLVLGVIHETGERKQNEKLLRDVAIARKSVEFKQKFLANMSHEIRTPLTGVLGMVELLSLTKLDRNQLDFVNTLKLSTEHLIEIINQILDYSKIEAGKIKLRKNIFTVKSVFENAHRFFNGICQKDIVLEANIDPQLPETIKADEQRIKQIVNNLLSNAVKFTLDGKISLRATLEKWVDDHNFMLAIEVSDTGIGIPKEFIPRLFSPFEQSEHSKRNLYFEGTGLGLPICKDLAELMGGRIGAFSEEGKGSTFYFTFVAEKIDPIEEQVDLEIKKETPENNKIRILFAEDKIINQKVVGLMLESMGHQVVMAQNGLEAIEKYKPGSFDLILMDIQMPEMDGVTATQILKNKYEDLPPVIALTANAFEGDREKYLEMGMDEYLAKPVKGEELKIIIDKVTPKK
jgi:PAS domain S-box-containing protein